MNPFSSFIATKNKEKTPPEVCESGGRWPHWDGSRRQRPKQRTTDNDETEECKVCKGKFKKGRGLKIHLAKSRCGKVTVQHRKTNKSEATNIPQDINHSGDGSRADRKLHREAKTSTRKDTKRERPSQIQAGKGSEAATEKKIKGGPTTTESNQEEATEIHVEEDLYNEVNLWVKNELEKGDPKEPPKKKAGKQPILRDWLIKKDGRERMDSQTEKKEERVENLTEKTEERAKPKALVQPDIRTVIIRPEEERRPMDKQSDSRTVPVKHENARKHVEQEGDTRTVLVNNKSGVTEPIVKGRRKMDVRNGPGEEVLSRNWMNLTRADYRTIQGKRYLNDKIIDSYIHLIQERSEASPDLPTVYGLTTFFYTQLSTFGLEEGSRRTQDWIKDDLRRKDWIFCPIHRHDHWTLIAIEIPTKTIHYLDSIVGSRNKSPAPGLFLRYMEAYFRKLGEEVRFKIRIRKDAPTQQNGVDCGVFLCQYAERMSRRGAFNFKQGDMPMARKRMTEELLNGRLDTENQDGKEVQQQQAWKTKTLNADSKTKKKTTEGQQSREAKRT